MPFRSRRWPKQTADTLATEHFLGCSLRFARPRAVSTLSRCARCSSTVAEATRMSSKKQMTCSAGSPRMRSCMSAWSVLVLFFAPMGMTLYSTWAEPVEKA